MYILSFEDVEPWYDVPTTLTTQLIVSHSLDLGMVLYIWCEPCLAKTFASYCLPIYMLISSKFQI
jgi:hypothetical protein